MLDHLSSLNSGDSNRDHAPEIVCETDHGCVTRCTGCEVIYVEFGNIILQLNPQRFGAFKSFMYNMKYEEVEAANTFYNIRRRIVIQVDKTNVTIVLNREEYFELLDLLQLTEICLCHSPLWRDC